MKSYGILLIYLVAPTIDFAKGLVELSPSAVAPVCQVGDQLELTCNVTGMFLRWTFTVIIESGSASVYQLDITSEGPDGVPLSPMVNSTTFTILRLSAQDITPLMSRMIINPVSEGLNGVQMACIDAEAYYNSMAAMAVTTIQIIGGAGDTLISNLSIRSHSEEFNSNRIILLLEWTISLSQLYYQRLLKNASINVVPDPEVIITYPGNMSAQLTLLYNIEYNVTVTQPGVCGRPNQTEFILLNYSKCRNPILLTHNNTQVMGYEEPAQQGESITFACTSGLELSGPNSSTCMGNGEWEPDPGEVNCTHIRLQPTVCGSPQYILQIRNSITIMTFKEFRNSGFNSLICCSGIVVIEADTMTCLEELNITQLRFEGCVSDPINDDKLRDTLIAVSCVLVVVSAVMLITGFLGGRYLGQKYRKSHDQATSNTVATPDPSSEVVDDLELNKNVAYITLRPR